MEFFASRSIDDAELIAWVTRVFAVSSFALNQLPTDAQQGWVESVFEAGGEYPHRITFFFRGNLSVSQQVARACDFTNAMQCEVLTSDEQLNPYSWVLVTRDGRALSVFVDVDSADKGEFVVVGPANNR